MGASCRTSCASCSADFGSVCRTRMRRINIGVGVGIGVEKNKLPLVVTALKTDIYSDSDPEKM